MATTYDEFGNVVEVVTAQELIDQQNREFLASGGANDDQTKPATPAANPTPSTLSTDTATKATASADVPEVVVTASRPNPQQPGKRLENPLGDFASYTYQLTLYMITPDAYNAYIESGRRDINAIRNAANSTVAQETSDIGAGAYIIAQSGGINDTTSLRLPGMKYDYYIDDLKITTATSGKSTGTSSNVTNMTFTIIEPYGFSFVTRLKNAAAGMAEYSKLAGFAECENPMRQHFMIGVRFQGYDINGNLASASKTFTSETYNPSEKASGIFERFYDIEIVDMKFKIDGGATKYHFEAATKAPRVAYGTKKGRTHTGSSATARTVREALGGIGYQAPEGTIGILTQLNNQQEQLVKDGVLAIANKYDVKFIGNATDIENATIISKLSDPDKTRWPMAPVKNSSLSNDIAAVKSAPDGTKRVITFKNDTSIMQMITSIITQSSYLEDALKTIYATSTKPKSKVDGEDAVEEESPDSNQTIKWYNLGSEIKCLGYDTKAQDFAYQITYIIQPYETPVVVSSYANQTSKYYGPHKRYEYWFTGKNSEILRYEQNLNLAYFTVKPAAKGESDNNPSGAAQVPVVPGMHTPVARLGRLGQGMEAQNNYVTSLIDPDSFAEAKITIIGDPDYLIQDSPSSISSVYNQFYGSDGYTINANGGQVFIEINFKEAIDYDHNKGVMEVNDKIKFWEYPKEIAEKVQGVSYMVLEVVSIFRGGKFTQELTATINTFPGASGTAGPSAKSGAGTSSAGAGRGNGQAELAQRRKDAKLGDLKAEPAPPTDPSGADDGAAIMNAAGTAPAKPPTQKTTPTKNANNPAVADDDSVGSAGNMPI